MERRAQLHIKIFIICTAMFAGCSKTFMEKQPVSTGYIQVMQNDLKLSRISGSQYYESLLFTGKITELYLNGDTAKITEYKNGKENGRQILYYENHRRKEESIFEYGKKEGEHTGWWENGNLKFVINYKNDVFEGSFRGWSESGFLFRDFNYKEGQEEGLQRSWFPDGKLQMNYVVKNNRKYGLTGVKNCRSENEK